MRLQLTAALLGFFIAWMGSSAAFAQTTGATFGSVINLGGTPSDVVIDDARSRIYSVNSTANRVDVLSLTEKKVLTRITVGNYPLAAALSPDKAFLYVTNTQSATLSVIDLGTDSVVNTVSLPAKPEGVAAGSDGRVLITTQGTGPQNQLNTLLLFDRTQTTGQQIFSVPSPPAISTPNPLPPVFAGRPATAFPGRLLATPGGNFIIGMVAINQNANTAQTTLFVYEVASGTVIRNRTVTGQSTVLSMTADGSRFMAGSTLYDTATLAAVAQMSTANLPFFIGANFNPTFNIQRNLGGTVYSPDATTLYSAFNTSATTARPVANVLYVTNPRNLGVRLGIRLKESILGAMAITQDGADVFAISESGLIHLPVSTLFDYPILQAETTQVFLAVDNCNKRISRAEVNIANLGKGRLSYSIPNTTTALVMQQSSGLAPSKITFTMEPGRSGVVRQPGTNLFTNAGGGGGTAINITLQSIDAINYPNVIRVYMNYRERDQRGIIFPLPVTLNNGEGLWDMIHDEKRGRLYITNSGFNRIEIFDTRRQRFLNPLEVGQLPHAMAITPDGQTLYVGNTGGESISIVDLDTMRVTGEVEFPPIPRIGQQTPLRPLAMAYGLSGLQFIMSNGSFWRLIGTQATVRPANSITPTTIPGPVYMVASPGGEYILTMAGNSNAYLYDALSDTYTASRQLYDQAPVSYFGPLAAGGSGSYFLANGLILSPSLAIVGGAERPGVTQFGPPPAPGQPPTQTIVSNGQRNVASVYPLDENLFLRMTTPVRQNINAATRDDARATLEMVNIATGAETVIAVSPENPQFSVFGAARVNVPARQMIVDPASQLAYTIGVSGLSIIPVYPNGAAPRPVITSGNRGIVNTEDGTPNFKPGSFITVNGSRLANAAVADTIPPPTVLGGSCIVMNELPLPLLQTSDGQITGQIPENLAPGSAVVQVRSLLRAEQSDPVVVTIRR
jgi:YVTN family beta-propeller protein